MSASLTVTIQTLTNAVTQLRNQNSRLQTELSNMNSNEASLNAAWDGPANDAFHQAYLHDRQQIQNFITAITQYIKALEDAIDQYRLQEGNNYTIATQRNYN